MGNSLIKLIPRNRNNDNGADNNRNRVQSIREDSNEMLDTSSVDESQHLLSSLIFKLNGHCFDELFEYLSLKDLHSLGQTCKSMQHMTGEFFIRNYSGAKFNCLRDGIYLINSDAYRLTIDECIPVPGFMHLTTWIAIENNILAGHEMVDGLNYTAVYHCDLAKFEYIKLHADELKSVKKLTLTNVSINKQTVRYVQKILPNIEVLELMSCTVCRDLFDVLLKYCKNVRRIQLTYVNLNAKYKWLRRHYEKIEHLELSIEYPKRMNSTRFTSRFTHSATVGAKVSKLCRFFERNPNLRSFSCDRSTLMLNKDALLNSKVKLDTFELQCVFFIDKSLWHLLYQLHAHGFYKRLHISARTNNHRGQMPAMQFLQQLSIAGCDRSLAPFSKHLIEYAEPGASFWLPIHNRRDKEFWINSIPKTGKTRNEILAEDIINVERLYLSRIMLDIPLFTRKLKNLKKFKLVRFYSAEILELDVLNKAREQLTGAQKVTIYVPDNVFLATKWATKNGTTNFSLIEMKRTHSIEWNRSIYGAMGTVELPPGMF